jgi:hypothetical protein
MFTVIMYLIGYTVIGHVIYHVLIGLEKLRKFLDLNEHDAAFISTLWPFSFFIIVLAHVFIIIPRIIVISIHTGIVSFLTYLKRDKTKPQQYSSNTPYR